MTDYRAWVKAGLFMSSYIPLWLAMALKTHTVQHTIRGLALPWITLGFLLLTFLSGLILHQAISIRERREPKYRNIDSYKSRHDLLTSYLIAYIFPFANLNYNNWTNWAIFGIFFLVLAAIQIRSSQLHVNPILAALGYNIYEIEGDGKGTNMLVAKKDVNLEQDRIKTVELSNQVYLTV